MRLSSIALSLISLAACALATPPHYYVKADAPDGGDGLSWETAFNDLHDALAFSSFWPVDERTQIWVAKGTYVPGIQSQSSRNTCFTIGASTDLYGGFAGSETTLEERDLSIVENASIIDGSDYFYHVIQTGEKDNSVIDGFTISGAYHPLSDASDGWGGALMISGGDIRITNCIFRDNLAYGGAAIYCYYAGKGAIINCTFVNNEAQWLGGAIFGYKLAPMIGCIFAGNIADEGGAIFPRYPHAEITNCTFTGNQANRGGAIACETSISIYNSTFFANKANCSGGAIHLRKSFYRMSDPSGLFVENSIFWGNSTPASQNAAAQITVNLEYPHPVSIKNSCIQNWDDRYPGENNISVDPHFVDPLGPDGVVGTPDDDLRLVAGHSPCIDAGDSTLLPVDHSDVDGDGDKAEPIPFDQDTNPRVDGTTGIVDMGAFEGGQQGLVIPPLPITVVEGHTLEIPVRLAFPPTSTVTVTTTLETPSTQITLDGGSTLQFDATNYDAPQMITLNTSVDGDLLHAETSLTFTAESLLEYTFTKAATVLIIDSEAIPARLYVNDDANGDGTGTSWENAFTTLDQALQIAHNHRDAVSEIWIAGGTYMPGTTMDATYKMRDGLDILGGFVGNETEASQRDFTNPQAETILTGDRLGDDTETTTGSTRGIPITNTVDALPMSNMSENNYRIIDGVGIENATLDGVTIRNANSCKRYPYSGAGAILDGSSMTIRNCIFTQNAADSGGALNITWANGITFENCRFIDNHAECTGAAISSYKSVFFVHNCDFDSNHSIDNGPTLWMFEGETWVTNSSFKNNYTKRQGTTYFIGLPHLFENCLFEGNTADEAGGAIGVEYGTGTVNDCTFRNNNAPRGGAVAVEQANFYANNSAFESNTATIGGAIGVLETGYSTIKNCLFHGNQTEDSGGAINFPSSTSSTLTLTGCTFASNRSQATAGGIFFAGHELDLSNSILWDNISSETSIFSRQLAAEIYQPRLSIKFSCIEGLDTEDLGNHGQDPLFIQPGAWDDNGTSSDYTDDTYAAGNFRLPRLSPCIDAGDPTYTAEIGETDLGGFARILDGNRDGQAFIDIGAFECPEYAMADLNCDGTIDVFDIDPFVTALTAPEDYTATYPDCDAQLADCNNDGIIDPFDIDAFVWILVTSN